MDFKKQNEERAVLEVQAKINKSGNQYGIPSKITQDIFRTYDIRGPVDSDNLTPDLAYAIGLSIASEAQTLGEKKLIVGRDGRLSGPSLHAALCEGVRAAGCHVLDIGQVPTPLVYFATHRLSTSSGIMITASHNPGHHNGFKIVLKGKTLSSDDISKLYQRILNRDFVRGAGQYETYDGILSDYLNYITAHIKLERPLKIVVDCGNGIAGEIAPLLYRSLGCEVIELYCEIDGRFPNHHPDPTVPENLVDLINAVKSSGADVGLAFDGDADRLGVITNQGEIIWPDRQLMLFAQDVLLRQPNAKIIFDVKCSRNLTEVIRSAGGQPLMWRTGHSIIKNKMFEENSPLAGEMSGHIFFKDQWFGFDDGIYVGARLLRILSQQNQTCSSLFATLPNSINTPELKLPMPEHMKTNFMNRLMTEINFGEKDRITIDGLRVDFGYGWGLIRPSNTSPYLILRFEADTTAHLQQIKDIFRKQLLSLNPLLELPF